MKTLPFLASILFGSAAVLAHSHQTAAITELAASANAFMDSLDSKQLDKVKIPFDSPGRMDWHFIPKDRKGLAWMEMTDGQKTVSMEFLGALMSQAGMRKVKGVIGSETILWEESNHSDHRNPENYHFTLFGNPGVESTWGASVEGHHLSINLTIVDGHEISVTPSFMGSNPDRSTSGHQPLAAEMMGAQALYDSLDADQRQLATMEEKPPRDILTGSSQKASAPAPQGLMVSDMTADQVKLLRQLMVEYIGRYRESLAADDWEKIEKAGFDKIQFLWSQRPEPNKALYYRIQGPTFVMEYANSQNHGNHSHTVWRDFEGDFGHDALGAHMSSAH